VKYGIGYTVNGLFLLIYLFFISEQTWASNDQDKRKEEILTIVEGRFLHSGSEHPPDFSSSESQLVTLPDQWEESRYAEGHSGWYHFDVTKTFPLETQWSVYLPKLNMNAVVYFNSHFIGDGGSFEEPLARNWNRPPAFLHSQGSVGIG